MPLKPRCLFPKWLLMKSTLPRRTISHNQMNTSLYLKITQNHYLNWLDQWLNIESLLSSSLYLQQNVYWGIKWGRKHLFSALYPPSFQFFFFSSNCLAMISISLSLKPTLQVQSFWKIQHCCYLLTSSHAPYIILLSYANLQITRECGDSPKWLYMWKWYSI